MKKIYYQDKTFLTELFKILIEKYNPQNIFEIGIARGNRTLQFAEMSSHTTKVYAIDLKENEKPILPISFETQEVINQYNNKLIGKCYKDEKGELLNNKITELRGDTAAFDFSPYYGKMDLIFVDGAHDYDYVKNDSEIALKLLSNKGIIIWHDYCEESPDVIRYLDELSEEYKDIFTLLGSKCAFLLKGIDMKNPFLSINVNYELHQS